METVRFLRDIDDEKAYAQSLELCYVDAFNHITDIVNRMYEDVVHEEHGSEATEIADRHKELRHVLFTMGLVISDCGDRRKRLADVAGGLADVILDEQTT
jgi:hypothetical protein